MGRLVEVVHPQCAALTVGDVHVVRFERVAGQVGEAVVGRAECIHGHPPGVSTESGRQYDDRRAWRAHRASISPATGGTSVAASVHVAARRRDHRTRADPSARSARTEERAHVVTGWSIVRAIDDADSDDDVRVVALTGNGDVLVRTRPGRERWRAGRHRALGPTARARREGLGRTVPVGAPVRDRQARDRGDQRGGRRSGLSLAMAADIRIAADSARLHPGYLRAGTSPTVASRGRCRRSSATRRPCGSC